MKTLKSPFKINWPVGFQTGTNLGMDWLGFHLWGGEGSKNLQKLSMYLLNGPPARHWSPAEQLLNCSYLTINHRIFGPYSLLCSVGCNCKPVIIRDVGTMGQGGRWERAHKGLKSPKRFTNLPLDSSRCPGEKGRLCIKRKQKSGSNKDFVFSTCSPFFTLGLTM